MKKFFILLMTMAGLSTTINAQVTIDETNFPDPEFRAYLLDQSYGQDGIITDEEIAEITTLSLSDTYIADFTGLNLFTSLENFSLKDNERFVDSPLDFSGFQMLTSIRLNSCEGFSSITMSNCPQLSDIYIFAMPDISIGELTVSDCPNPNLNIFFSNGTFEHVKLINLEISRLSLPMNIMEYSLEVVNCPNLSYLSTYMSGLKSLTLTNCPELSQLNIAWTDLTSLDLSGCPKLTSLDCHNVDLTSLDLSNNPLLSKLVCYSNQLTSLDLSGCPKLSYLDCHNNQLTSLDLSNNPELSTLGCRNNLLSSLELNTSKLKVLSCGYNQLTSLDLSNCPELEGIQCNNNQLSDKAMFDMVISIPDRSETTAGNIYAIDLTSGTEKNVCTTTTVGVARAINWYINAWTENGWEEYEGSDPTGLNEIDAAKMGNGTRYNLMGQPVGNDYKGIVIENGQKFIVR